MGDSWLVVAADKPEGGLPSAVTLGDTPEEGDPPQQAGGVAALEGFPERVVLEVVEAVREERNNVKKKLSCQLCSSAAMA